MKKIAVLFPLKGTSQKKKYQYKTELDDNSQINNFSSQDLSRLIQLCQKDYKNKKPILFIGYNYTGATAWIYRNFPPDFLKKISLEFLFYGTEEKFVKRKQEFPWTTYSAKDISAVFVGENGQITLRNWKLLRSIITNRTLIILSGGPGHPQDLFYGPLRKALVNVLKQHTPILGICMGHELLGFIHNSFRKSDAAIRSGFLEFGPQTEIFTSEAVKIGIVKKPLQKVTLMRGNEHHLEVTSVGNHIAHGKIFMRSLATNLPTGIIWDFTYSNQAVSLQGHPEIELLDKSGTASQLYQEIIKEDFWDNREYFFKNYYITKTDAKNLLNKNRLCKHLGFRFIGRVLLYLLENNYRKVS